MAGAGKVVFDCPYEYYDHGPVPAVKPWLYDVATGQLAKARGADGLASYEVDQPAVNDVYTAGIGTRLLAATLPLDSGDRTLLLDPVRKRFFAAPAQTSRTAPSLDVPSGRVPLCAPLRRPTVLVEDDHGRNHRAPQPVAYVRPYLAYSTPASYRDTSAHQVVLQHCGSAKRTVLSHTTAPILLSDRYVAWSKRGLHLRYLATGRQYVFRLPHSCDEILGGGRFVVCYTTGGSSSLIDLDAQP